MPNSRIVLINTLDVWKDTGLLVRPIDFSSHIWLSKHNEIRFRFHRRETQLVISGLNFDYSNGPRRRVRSNLWYLWYWFSHSNNRSWLPCLVRICPNGYRTRPDPTQIWPFILSVNVGQTHFPESYKRILHIQLGCFYNTRLPAESKRSTIRVFWRTDSYNPQT